MRGWPRPGDKVRLKPKPGMVKFPAEYYPVYTVFEGYEWERSRATPIFLGHPYNGTAGYYARREIECIVGK